MFEVIITDDEADWNILKLANPKGKFAIQVGPLPVRQEQEAFERGIDNEWWRLVDIGPVSSAPRGLVFRIFKLTEAGRARRVELAVTFQ